MHISLYCHYSAKTTCWSCLDHLMIRSKPCDDHIIRPRPCDDHNKTMWWSCRDHVMIRASDQEHVFCLFFRHCQESNSQPVPSQVRVDRPQWQCNDPAKASWGSDQDHVMIRSASLSGARTRMHIYYIIQQNEDPRMVKSLFPPRLELGTFRVLGERDNHYTTETHDK